ncbi:MAG: (2Fe-2S)-binding protein [Synergistaceae bacterium]
MKLSFELNGRKYSKEADPSKRLIDFLRDDMGLTGTKEGCGEGECGSCTIIMDRKAVLSCMVLVGQINNRVLLTVEGLSDGDELSELQKAFIRQGAVQCGYCTPGMLMSATALLMENDSPTEEEIRTALAGNICRCGDYSAIVDALKEASETEREKRTLGRI